MDDAVPAPWDALGQAAGGCRAGFVRGWLFGAGCLGALSDSGFEVAFCAATVLGGKESQTIYLFPMG